MSSTTPATRPKVYNELAVKANATSILFVRASASTIAGIAAGILGLSGLYGFVFYAVISAVTGLLLLALKTEGKPDTFFKDWSGVWLDEVFGNLFSFVLFWTLGWFSMEQGTSRVRVHLD